MSGELEQHDGPYVTSRRDVPYKGRKRLMIKQATRVKHPLASVIFDLTFLVLGTLSGFAAPVLDAYYGDFTRLMLLLGTLALGCAMFYKHEALYRAPLGLPIRPYVRCTWVFLGMAFWMYGLPIGNEIYRLWPHL